MTKHLKNIIYAVGSVVSVAPSTDFKSFVPKQNAEERMYGHWNNAGKHIQKAINTFEHGQKK